MEAATEEGVPPLEATPALAGQPGPQPEPGLLTSQRSERDLRERFCEPDATREQATFRSLSASNYKKKVLDEHREPNSDWRTTPLSLDGLELADARGRPEDLNRCASQDRALGTYRELLAARKFDELAVLVWTFGGDLNLPEVYNGANSTLLCDDPGRLDVYSGFMSSVNRYIGAQRSLHKWSSSAEQASAQASAPLHSLMNWARSSHSGSPATRPRQRTKPRPQSLPQMAPRSSSTSSQLASPDVRSYLRNSPRSRGRESG
jgi:hypothetical protein